MSEWVHLSNGKTQQDRSSEVFWIALGFLALFVPGFFLAWRYPASSKLMKWTIRLSACTVVLPMVWAIGVLVRSLMRFLAQQFRKQTA